MTTYYIDQEDGAAVAGTVYTAPRDTIPTAVDGDAWGFPVGKTFNVRLTGAGTTTFLTGGKTLDIFVYNPSTGDRVTSQFDPYERYKNGLSWPTEAEIAANYAYIDGGVVANSTASITEGDARSIVAQMAANCIVRGLCVQNGFMMGFESNNVGTCDYTIDYCIVRNIGNVSPAPRSPIDTTGIGIRHARVSEGQMRVYHTFIEHCEEDAIWAADTAGSIDPLIQRNWVRHIGAGVPSSSYHADGVQLGNSPGDFVISENIFEASLPESLIGGAVRIGCAILLGGTTGSTGGLIERNIIITNAAGINWGASSGVTIRKNKITLLSNPETLTTQGYDDDGLTGTTGAGHTIKDNLITTERKCGGNGFLFGEVDWMQGSTLTGNVFVSTSADSENACFDTRTSTTAVAQNNVFIGFETAIVNTTSPLATESNNAFWNCARKRSMSKTGGTEQSVDASDVVTDPLLSPSYRPLPSSPLIGAGTYIAD